jgi:hypothetical protein
MARAGGPDGVRWITIAEVPTAVPPASGLIYSTAPQLGTCIEDSDTYYLKGPDLNVVFAEAVAYQLAALVGLSVPEFAAWEDPRQKQTWFASRAIAFRSGVADLIKNDHRESHEFLASCVAFDTWIANADRNSGNLLAQFRPDKSSNPWRFYAIDFEKSQVLRGESQFAVAMVPPRDFRPKGELASVFSKLDFPSAMCERIAGVGADAIEGVIQRLIWSTNFPPVDWADRAAKQLADRGSKIIALTREVWDGNSR